MMSMKGSFYGILYMANEQNASGPVLTLQANSEVFGGVAVDGPGRLVAGQASGNRSTITFMPNAFTRARELRHDRARPEHLARATPDVTAPWSATIPGVGFHETGDRVVSRSPGL